MTSAWSLILDSILLGIGLAMDAFSVSVVNGLREPGMLKGRMSRIAVVFGGFQMLMPMIGWVCVRTILEVFQSLQKYIPWIAFILLLLIGGKMVLEGIRNKEADDAGKTGTGGLLLQGVATSVDALSVGFTMTALNWAQALAESMIIGGVTFGICVSGILIGQKVGTKLSGKASVLGGIILIAIGIKIVIRV